MKPSVPVAHAADYTVRQCAHAEAARLVKDFHYAGGCSNTGTAFGLYRSDTLVGVSLWIPPTRRCAESVCRHFALDLILAGTPTALLLASAVLDDWRSVVSLSRLVVVPGEPQNCAGMLMARSLRQLDAKWRWAVTFADARQGHTGTVYAATGWEYAGERGGDAVWLDAAGRQVSRKRGPVTLTRQQMLDAGYVSAGPSVKRRFVCRRRT